MARKSKRKKPGPRTPWQNRVRYNRAKCEKRLKPSQIENLAAADMFARWLGTPLNRFVTIHFHGQPDPKRNFEAAIARLSKWHRRWGGEWVAIHVWEATGGFHVHFACHCPKNSDAVHAAIKIAFAGCDIDIRARTRGQGMMAYLCKGTDVVSHARIRGPRTIKARKQGIIAWKRCGTTQNIGRRARERAGFEVKKHQNNCAKTSPRDLDTGNSQRTHTNANGGNADAFPTYIVSQTDKTSCKMTTNTALGNVWRAALMTQAATRDRASKSSWTRAQARAMRTARTI